LPGQQLLLDRRSSTALAPNGLAESEMSFASVRVRATPTLTGTPTSRRILSRIASAVCWSVLPRIGTAWKKNSSIE
jgi:hypothetical protein